MLTYTKISRGCAGLSFPVRCQGESEALIRALLESLPSMRLPVKKGGFANLERHTWYSGINWKDLRNLKAAPPFRPVVKSHQDMGNFKIPKNNAPVEPYKDDGS